MSDIAKSKIRNLIPFNETALFVMNFNTYNAFPKEDIDRENFIISDIIDDGFVLLVPISDFNELLENNKSRVYYNDNWEHPEYDKKRLN